MQIIYLESKKEKIKLFIGDGQYEEIQVVTENNELIASITDEDVIEKTGYKVICVPYGKTWGDREFLQTGCSKLTDIIYKHGNDITASFNITGALKTQDDIEEYKEIAEYVVSCVHNKVKELRMRKGYSV